jgi:hypothetical protein
VVQTGSARLKTVCGLVVTAIGLSALAGWGTGHRVLSGIRPDYIPMAPNTAVGFLLLGIALVTMPGNAGGVWRRALAVGGAGFVAGLVAFALAEYALAIDLGVHGWFYRRKRHALHSLPPASSQAEPIAMLIFEDKQLDRPRRTFWHCVQYDAIAPQEISHGDRSGEIG